MTHFTAWTLKLPLLVLFVLFIYVDCLFLHANEGRKDESSTSDAMEKTSSSVKPIDTIFFEKPIINV